MTEQERKEGIQPGLYWLGALVAYLGTFAAGLGLYLHPQAVWVVGGVVVMVAGMWVVNKAIIE